MRSPESLASRLATFVRSCLAGLAASIADLATLGFVVAVLGVSPRAANVPALLVGAVVQFVGNRTFAFRASGGSVPRQAALFAAAEAVALALNGIAYHLVATRVPLNAATAMLARAITTNIVYLAWSFPTYRAIFHGGDEGLRA